MISMGYAALNKNLSISGEAFLRVQESVRITGIKLNTAANEGYETYIPEYSKRTTKAYSTLPLETSSTTYTAQITNLTGVKYKVDSINISNTNENVECTASITQGSIIENGITDFQINVKYKGGITVSENIENTCLITYEFSPLDMIPPTVTIEMLTDEETSKTVKLTIADDEGGSGLSSENNYKYYLSTSNTELLNGEWKKYVNKESFTIEGKNQTKYLWIYPIKDNAGNINDEKVNIDTPYVIGSYNYLSTYTITYNTNMDFTYSSTQGYTVTNKGDYYNATFTKTSGTTNEWNHIYFPHYSYELGATYEIRMTVRLNSKNNATSVLRHSSIENDHWTPGHKGVDVSEGTIGQWQEYKLVRTFDSSTYTNSSSVTYNVNPLIEIYSNNLALTDTITSRSISFDFKDVYAGKITSVTRKYGENLGTVADPKRSGYKFEGWYTDPTAGTRVTSSTKVSDEDVTYYAHWTAVPVITFTYTGAEQTYTAPTKGYYKIEAWGAQGWSSTDVTTGGLGGYTRGYIYLNKGEVLHIYIGKGNGNGANTMAFNNGTPNHDGNAGGGATDIRLVGGTWTDATSINSRIMVAGGGGSGSHGKGGAGGGLFGNDADGTKGGTQTSPGASQTTNYTDSSFGIANGGCSGGNGYYPGGGARCADGAGGGSSFISGYAGVNAITSASNRTHTDDTLHYSGKYFINVAMKKGVNSGNGKARIAYISEAGPVRQNKNLNNVRYIKDCLTGSTVNTSNHWVELQAIYQGKNVAKGKSITSLSSPTTSYGTGSISSILDSDITYSKYVDFTAPPAKQCITVDLGQNYNLDEIAVWHYWGGTRTYFENDTFVSSDNSTWKKVTLPTAQETNLGVRVNAYENYTAPLKLSIKLNGGKYASQEDTVVYYVQSGKTINLLTPTKAGYTFTGWTVSGTGSKVSGTTFTMGSANATLTANWTVAGPTSFSYTGAAQYYTAPATGNYEITLYGAKGGNGGLGLCSGGSGGAGGNGGYVKAKVKLTKGQKYTVWVGGKGTDSSYGDTQEGTGGLSDGVTGGTGVRVSGGGGGGGGSSYIALGDTVYLRANGGGGGGGGADGGWYRKSNGSTTCGGCKYRNMGAGGARGGNGGGGTAGGNGAANSCQASGSAGSAGTHYVNSTYSTVTASGSTGTGNGSASIKYVP